MSGFGPIGSLPIAATESDPAEPKDGVTPPTPPKSYTLNAEPGEYKIGAADRFADVEGSTPNVGSLSVTLGNVALHSTATIEDPPAGRTPQRFRLEPDRLYLLATSLAKLARNEIARIDNERPNDPTVVARLAKERELMEIFAKGFSQLASALAELAQNKNEPILVGRAAAVAEALGGEISSWWGKNKADAVDWCVRIPAIGVGVSVLSVFGIDPTLAASIVAALVGGHKVAAAIKGEKAEQVGGSK